MVRNEFTMVRKNAADVILSKAKPKTLNIMKLEKTENFKYNDYKK